MNSMIRSLSQFGLLALGVMIALSGQTLLSQGSDLQTKGWTYAILGAIMVATSFYWMIKTKS